MSHLPFFGVFSSHFSKVVDVPFFGGETQLETVIVDTCRYDIPIPTSTGTLPPTYPTYPPHAKQLLCHLRLEGEASRLDESIGDLEAEMIFVRVVRIRIRWWFCLISCLWVVDVVVAKMMKSTLDEKRDAKTLWWHDFCWGQGGGFGGCFVWWFVCVVEIDVIHMLCWFCLFIMVYCRLLNLLWT